MVPGNFGHKPHLNRAFCSGIGHAGYTGLLALWRSLRYLPAMKTALPLFMMLAALPLACCGRPQTVSDFKTALVRLSVAGDQDRTPLSAYQSLLLDAQAKFEL